MSTRIVLLNGAGSAGKTSIALALQAIAEQPFLHVQMDIFIDMLPEHLQDHPDGFAYPTAGSRSLPSAQVPPVSAFCRACAMPSLPWPHRGTIWSSMRCV